MVMRADESERTSETPQGDSGASNERRSSFPSTSIKQTSFYAARSLTAQLKSSIIFRIRLYKNVLRRESATDDDDGREANRSHSVTSSHRSFPPFLRNSDFSISIEILLDDESSVALYLQRISDATARFYCSFSWFNGEVY